MGLDPETALAKMLGEVPATTPEKTEKDSKKLPKETEASDDFPAPVVSPEESMTPAVDPSPAPEASSDPATEGVQDEDDHRSPDEIMGDLVAATNTAHDTQSEYDSAAEPFVAAYEAAMKGIEERYGEKVAQSKSRVNELREELRLAMVNEDKASLEGPDGYKATARPKNRLDIKDEDAAIAALNKSHSEAGVLEEVPAHFKIDKKKLTNYLKTLAKNAGVKTGEEWHAGIDGIEFKLDRQLSISEPKKN